MMVSFLEIKPDVTDATVNSVAYYTRPYPETIPPAPKPAVNRGRSRNMKTVNEMRLTTETVQGTSLA